MPYIKPDSRKKYEKEIEALVDKLRETARRETTSAFPGDLNYIITSLVKRSYDAAAKLDNFKLGYGDFNEIIGMLECCKLELYRRTLAPYEDKKRKENGDV